MTNSPRFERHTATINEVLAAGEGSKAFIKRGLEAVNYLYDMVRDDVYSTMGYDNHLPMYPHEVREAKHKEWFGDFWPRVAELVETREALRALPILTRQPKQEGVETKIRRTILDEIKARKEGFDIAKRIVELFAEFTTNEYGLPVVKGLPLHCDYVYCSNQFGTHWIRIDWYLSGRKTAFNSIMAACEQVKAERERAA